MKYNFDVTVSFRFAVSTKVVSWLQLRARKRLSRLSSGSGGTFLYGVILFSFKNHQTSLCASQSGFLLILYLMISYSPFFQKLLVYAFVRWFDEKKTSFKNEDRRLFWGSSFLISCSNKKYLFFQNTNKALHDSEIF